MVCDYHAMPKSPDVGDYVERKYKLDNGTVRLYEVGPACTACRSGKGWCYKGLCVDSCSGLPEADQCVCGLEGHCKNGQLNQQNCQCDCDQDHAGYLCDQECKNFITGCTQDHCQDPQKAKTQCPAFCGQCTCKDHGKCVNGAYDASPEVCGCVCEGGWTGEYCDKCVQTTCK